MDGNDVFYVWWRMTHDTGTIILIMYNMYAIFLFNDDDEDGNDDDNQS